MAIRDNAMRRYPNIGFRAITEITSEATVTGKAKRAAGTVVGHFAAQVLGVIAWVMIIASAALAAAGYFWT